MSRRAVACASERRSQRARACGSSLRLSPSCRPQRIVGSRSDRTQLRRLCECCARQPDADPNQPDRWTAPRRADECEAESLQTVQPGLPRCCTHCAPVDRRLSTEGSRGLESRAAGGIGHSATRGRTLLPAVRCAVVVSSAALLSSAAKAGRVLRLGSSRRAGRSCLPHVRGAVALSVTRRCQTGGTATDLRATRNRSRQQRSPRQPSRSGRSWAALRQAAMADDTATEVCGDHHNSRGEALFSGS